MKGLFEQWENRDRITKMNPEKLSKKKSEISKLLIIDFHLNEWNMYWTPSQECAANLNLLSV